MVCAHLSKYGNIGNHERKFAVKYAKNQKKLGMRLEGRCSHGLCAYF
jgi:hypothetical protein